MMELRAELLLVPALALQVLAHGWGDVRDCRMTHSLSPLSAATCDLGWPANPDDPTAFTRPALETDPASIAPHVLRGTPA